jgi:hypothetical protein
MTKAKAWDGNLLGSGLCKNGESLVCDYFPLHNQFSRSALLFQYADKLSHGFSRYYHSAISVIGRLWDEYH